jgi:hypothetical protein
LAQVMQTKPFQLALEAQTQVLLAVSSTCPLAHLGMGAQAPWKRTWPGAQPQALIWLFHTNPLEHLKQELPFQLDPLGQAQLFAAELQD